VEINFRQSQIASLNGKETKALSSLGKNASTAEKLIAAFDKRDDVNYLYVTYHPVDGLLVMSSSKKKKLTKKVSWNDSELLNDNELKQIHEENGLGSDGRLLLIFMWATAEELRLAGCFLSTVPVIQHLVSLLYTLFFNKDISPNNTNLYVFPLIINYSNHSSLT
jgi:hypothetical protein